MHNSKINQLLDFLKDDPTDSFTLYALALEFEKEDKGKAKQYFDQLLSEHPDYLATYYQAGKLYESTSKDRAKEIYTKGILVARSHGKLKILAELQNALNLLIDDE